MFQRNEHLLKQTAKRSTFSLSATADAFDDSSQFLNIFYSSLIFFISLVGIKTPTGIAHSLGISHFCRHNAFCQLKDLMKYLC
jgi:hypothetical protein